MRVGRPAIHRTIVAAIQSLLLKRCVSKAAIARKTGVSNRTVGRVADGTHVSLKSQALPRCQCGALLLVTPCKTCEARNSRGLVM